ncbi:MAG TPA: Rrf2 family transcriptional regulator [Bryobacteraceae bacterium]|nr:Rrf2 family transcriptional regulator [Bryobacteraceae bacterium]HUI54328.1 Rrf2 family transcriptional regulator [Bryobacteraceae bacterium]
MISTTSQYALRALTFMAGLPEGTTVLSRDLADATQVPRNYLAKVLLTLRNAGFLQSTRGAGGGYRLNKPADHIYLIDVVELFEGSKAKPNCLLNNRACSDETPCNAHKVWKELSMVYTGFLVTTTLAAVASATRN